MQQLAAYAPTPGGGGEHHHRRGMQDVLNRRHRGVALARLEAHEPFLGQRGWEPHVQLAGARGDLHREPRVAEDPDHAVVRGQRDRREHVDAALGARSAR